MTSLVISLILIFGFATCSGLILPLAYIICRKKFLTKNDYYKLLLSLLVADFLDLCSLVFYVTPYFMIGRFRYPKFLHENLGFVSSLAYRSVSEYANFNKIIRIWSDLGTLINIQITFQNYDFKSGCVVMAPFLQNLATNRENLRLARQLETFDHHCLDLSVFSPSYTGV